MIGAYDDRGYDVEGMMLCRSLVCWNAWKELCLFVLKGCVLLCSGMELEECRIMASLIRQ